MTQSALTKRKKNKIRTGSRAVDVAITVVAGLITLVTIYPMYYVLILSLSEPNAAASMNVYLFPKGFYLGSYKSLFQHTELWRAYGNTLIYVLSILALRLATCLLAAYPLTVHGLKGRKLVVIYLLIPMYFSGGMIPSFLLIMNLGLYNTMWAIIIPSAVNIWHIILTRTYLASLPDSLRESAFIDGARHFQVLTKIFIPIAKPIIAVIAIYTIVDVWNSWFNSMVYQPNLNIQPLQMYLRRVLVEMKVDLTKLNFEETKDAVQRNLNATQMRYAMIIFTTLPVLFTYPFFQKYFVKGVMLGSLKG